MMATHGQTLCIPVPRTVTAAAVCLAFAAAAGEPVATFHDDFEAHAPGGTIGGAVPAIGDSWTRLAGNPAAMIVQEGIGIDGTRAVRFTRPPGAQQAVRGECDPRTGRIRPHTRTVIRASVCMENGTEGARLALEPRGYPGFKPTVWMKPEGTIAVWESRNGSEWHGKWVDTGANTHTGWQTLELTITWGTEENGRIAGTYNVTVIQHAEKPGADASQCIADNVPTLAIPVNMLLDVMIDTTDYGTTQTPGHTVWDDVQLSTSETGSTAGADTPAESKLEHNE